MLSYFFSICCSEEFHLEGNNIGYLKNCFSEKLFGTSMRTIDLRSAAKLYSCEISLNWAVEADSFCKVTVGFDREYVLFKQQPVGFLRIG